jgi:hypothetical protein
MDSQGLEADVDIYIFGVIVDAPPDGFSPFPTEETHDFGREADNYDA